jgi:Na+-translocating ferredoxin:NAD+ oxidoreductase RnfG subunit
MSALCKILSVALLFAAFSTLVSKAYAEDTIDELLSVEPSKRNEVIQRLIKEDDYKREMKEKEEQENKAVEDRRLRRLKEEDQAEEARLKRIQQERETGRHR